MSYKTIRGANGEVICFGPNQDWYVPTIPAGCSLTIEELPPDSTPHPNIAILAQIEAIEAATKTGRFAREFMLTAMIREAGEDAAKALASDPATTITAASILAAHYGYQKAKLVNDQITALRALLT